MPASEIGGGYLIWLWFKEDRSIWYGVSGAILLALYGVIATYQTASFGRVYATYGGVFIILSLVWASIRYRAIVPPPLHFHGYS